VAGFVTRGQPAAVRQISAMIAAGLPHALLLVGPRSVGKTTLALDIAAAQLCLAADPADRPDRVCRGCRLVDSGNHPDVHRLRPDGPGGPVGIDAIRGLITELSLLPVEGGARVAIVEAAHRLTEDAQNSLLKTLEEPPTGVTLILCAEDEDRLLPTIHSRVARVRLGTLAPRDIEELLAARAEADAPTANRLARLVGGRPGLAVAYARSAEAATIRGELARSLLDLADASRAIRLVRIRELLARAGDLMSALASVPDLADAAQGRSPKRRGRAGVAAPMGSAVAAPMGSAAAAPAESPAEPAAEPDPDAAATPGRASPADRRRGATALLDVWRDTARDLALVELGDLAGLHDPDMLEELTRLVARWPAGSSGRFLLRLDRAGQLLDANANPELTADVLALAWPRAARVA
jgi:DNA polymerase-3 subunit delta'